jgi:seryl-tRNA synthetase
MPEYAKTQFKKIVGSRIQVWEGVAKETSGGLKKKDLMISKSGTVVSKKASQAAKNRMKSGKGLCEYCIKQYKESKKKSTKKESKKKSKKKESKKKSTKKLVVKKPKGVTKNKVEELQKEIEKLREKAGRIAEKEGKMTKEVKNILETVTKKVREMIEMKKVLREKEKKK